MSASSNDRRGIALIIAVVALAVIGVLVASAHSAGVRAHRAGERRFLQTEALAAAEYGVERVAANAPLAAWRAMAPGAVDSAGPWVVGRANVSVLVTRLGDSLQPVVLVVGTGTVGPVAGRSARRRAGLTLAVAAGRFSPLGALTAGGPVTLGPGAIVEGADLPPAGWACPNAGGALPGIATSDATSVSTGACGPSCAGGAPPVAQLVAASDTLSYFAFGELGWSDVVATARPVPSVASPTPSSSAGACLTSDPANWGDPGRALPQGACEGFFPVLHASGDLHLAGGVGQGVLLVDGALTISGGARFVGMVIARGAVHAHGSGGRIEGALMAASQGGTTSAIAGPLTVVHSRCALQAAEQTAERVLPIPFLAWGEVY
jgi:Tfp pilus assembly protein PilX